MKDVGYVDFFLRRLMGLGGGGGWGGGGWEGGGGEAGGGGGREHDHSVAPLNKDVDSTIWFFLPFSCHNCPQLPFVFCFVFPFCYICIPCIFIL